MSEIIMPLDGTGKSPMSEQQWKEMVEPIFQRMIEYPDKSFQQVRNQETRPSDALLEARRNSKPCPFCGSKNLKFTYRMGYGHGDCGFSNARIICNDCSGSKGDHFNYGEPTELDEIRAYQLWNIRK